MTSLSGLQAENARLKALLADAAKALEQIVVRLDEAEKVRVVRTLENGMVAVDLRSLRAARYVHAAIVREIGGSA